MSVPRPTLDLHISVTRVASEALIFLAAPKRPAAIEIGAGDAPSLRLFFYDESSGSPVNIEIETGTDFQFSVKPRNGLASDLMWECFVFTKAVESGGDARTYYAGAADRYGSVISAYLAGREERPITVSVKTSQTGVVDGTAKTVLAAVGTVVKNGFSDADDDEIEDGGSP